MRTAFGQFTKEAVSKKEYNKKVSRKISHMDDAHPEWEHDQVVAASINDVKDDIKDKGGSLPKNAQDREYLQREWTKDFVRQFKDAGYRVKPHRTSRRRIEKKSSLSLLEKNSEEFLEKLSAYRWNEWELFAEDLVKVAKELIAGGEAFKEGVTEKDVDAQQLKMGIKEELEHTPDEDIAKEIALDHLAEMPDYYTRLEKMEKKASYDELDQAINFYLGTRHYLEKTSSYKGASGIEKRAILNFLRRAVKVPRQAVRTFKDKYNLLTKGIPGATQTRGPVGIGGRMRIAKDSIPSLKEVHQDIRRTRPDLYEKGWLKRKTGDLRTWLRGRRAGKAMDPRAKSWTGDAAHPTPMDVATAPQEIYQRPDLFGMGGKGWLPLGLGAGALGLGLSTGGGARTPPPPPPRQYYFG
jgi:hypothetical protein